ncbi:carbohydrate-binding domain-containing protein [Veronia nyctiphanis]|uniref:carbohydrate-binding domain-containing protein n=1 Tax=Veronia nyctiphanis TaxID=1278244 RepID=UPI001F15B46B|nr:carbohydrate-binding domain-containing protein [Veronia nyctiphanis]
MKLNLGSVRADAVRTGTTFTATQAMSAGWTVPSYTYPNTHDSQLVLTKFNAPNETGSALNDSVNTPYAVTIEAEDYDNYFDTEAEDYGSSNFGYSYRDGPNSGVDIHSYSPQYTNTNETNAGEHVVGWVNDGEWLEFETGLTAGQYRLELRGGRTGDGQVTVDIDGTTTTATFQHTGNRHNYEYQDIGLFDISSDEPSVKLTFRISASLIFLPMSPL